MRNVIVTGASTGIGRATAIALAKEGAHLLLLARTKERLFETKKLVEANGGSADIFVVDLSHVDSIDYFIQTLKNTYEQIDVLINIAGIWHGENEVFAGKDFADFAEQTIIDTCVVGIIAPSLLAYAVIPLMPKNGKIINLSGTFQTGAKGWLPYFVSKRGIEDLTTGLAQELEEKNIQVNGVSPSDTATEAYKKYFPEYIQDAVEPEKIAEQIVFLSSEKANGITGKIFVVKKGEKPFEVFHY